MLSAPVTIMGQHHDHKLNIKLNLTHLYQLLQWLKPSLDPVPKDSEANSTQISKQLQCRKPPTPCCRGWRRRAPSIWIWEHPRTQKQQHILHYGSSRHSALGTLNHQAHKRNCWIPSTRLPKTLSPWLGIGRPSCPSTSKSYHSTPQSNNPNLLFNGSSTLSKYLSSQTSPSLTFY